MKAVNFMYWLMGYFELCNAGGAPVNDLTAPQRDCIKKHVDLVFKTAPVSPDAPGASLLFLLRKNPAVDLGAIKALLDIAFKHDIDPTFGDAGHQAELDAIHGEGELRC